MRNEQPGMLTYGDQKPGLRGYKEDSNGQAQKTQNVSELHDFMP